MIAFIVGTTAELIKVAPVYHELRSRGRASEIWFSGQHVEELAGTLAELGLPEPEQWLVPRPGARNLAKPGDVPRWVAQLVSTVWRSRRTLRARLRSDGTVPIVLVHGDTFTAPIGAVLGRLLGAKVGHIEAGMRSGSLFHPFPEELNRRVVGLFVDIHFAPTATEARQLRHYRGTIVTTGANTIVDAVRNALASPPLDSLDLPSEYGIATLHRFELVRREDLYSVALQTLQEYSKKLPIVYFAGASERERLEAYGLMELFDGSNFILAEKLNYVAFLPILAKAKFVVTDSGGLQEETGHLGIPCAVHRARTERMNGEGVSMVLTGFSTEKLVAFLEDYERYSSEATLGSFLPSKVIVDAIEALDG